MRTFLAFTFSGLFLSACSSVTYQQEVQRTAATPAKFSGEVAVYWLEEGDQASGDGRFLYVPTRRAPLRFEWTDGDGRARTTVPGVMYTDGGSIPRFAQAFQGFSPWGYAPAYMVHDWVFEARQCITDQKATAEQKADGSIAFDDSVRLMAQSIRALDLAGRIDPETAAPALVTAAVGSPVSRRLWTDPDNCQNGPEFDRIREKYENLANPDRALAAEGRAVGGGATLVGLITF